MTAKPSALLRFFRDETGATVVEYAFLVALIIAVCIVVILSIGEKTEGLFSAFTTSFTAARP